MSAPGDTVTIAFDRSAQGEGLHPSIRCEAGPAGARGGVVGRDRRWFSTIVNCCKGVRRPGRRLKTDARVSGRLASARSLRLFRAVEMTPHADALLDAVAETPIEGDDFSVRGADLKVHLRASHPPESRLCCTN